MKNELFLPPPYIDDEEILTRETYLQLHHRVERVALNICVWENLPDGMRQMILERYLYYYGNAVFFRDELLEQYIILPITAEYSWDVNAYPIEYEVRDWCGRTWRLNKDNSVIIWNNYQAMPTATDVQIFATRLTNTARTSDNHLENQIIGKIVTVPESKKTGVKKLLERIKNYHLFTIASPAAQSLASQIQVLDTEVEYNGDKIDKHYSFLWHDCMSFMGVPSISDKVSGVTPIEAESERMLSTANMNAVINPRRDAVRDINKMFGLNIKVSFGGVNSELYNDAQNSDGGPGTLDASGNPGGTSNTL